jgi:hypothetical protein
MTRYLAHAIAATLLMQASASAFAADAGALTRDELNRCATQVQTLRSESARLTSESFDANAQKSAYDARSMQLRAEAEALAADDFKGSLALAEKQKQHNADLATFNARIALLRQQITEINAVRTQYDQNCSNRPYRRTDFHGMPEASQQAMRAGLSDVAVPYFDEPRK